VAVSASVAATTMVATSPEISVDSSRSRIVVSASLSPVSASRGVAIRIGRGARDAGMSVS
jgi:hypothetical protein